MNDRKQLFERLRDETDVLRDERIRGAFEKIDRADFVEENYQPEAYEDYPLPIGHGQTISQPTTVAFMLEKLAVKEGDRVLDVGSGSGWTTALLAQMVGDKGKVVGVERIPELVERGQRNLGKYNLKQAEIRKAGAELGLPDEASFDAILVSASAGEEHMADKLLEQLKEGGRMVVPIRNTITVYEKKKAGAVSKKEFPGFVFVPLVE